jgi:hypothetical protein
MLKEQLTKQPSPQDKAAASSLEERLAADGHALLQGVSPRQLKRLLRQTLELVILCAVCGRVQWRAAARTRL